MNGLYDTLAGIERTDWFEYGVILVATLTLVTRVLRPSWLQLVGVVVALLVIGYRIDKRRVTTERAYRELDARLAELYPKPENFHMDADILNLFWTTRDLRDFHSEGYDEALVATDNLLKLVSEMRGGVYHCAENLDIVRDQMNKALNHYQTIVFGLPGALVYQRRHKRALNALHVLLRRWVDRMVELCRRQYASGPDETERAKIFISGSQFYGAEGYQPPGALTEKTIDIDWHPVYNGGPRPSDLDNAESSRWDFYY